MHRQIADDEDLELDPLRAGGVVGVADVTPGVLEPRLLNDEDARACVHALRADDELGAGVALVMMLAVGGGGLLEPEVLRRRDALADAGQDDRLAGLDRGRADALVETRRNWVTVL